MTYNDETYKGVKIKFFKDENTIYAQPYGFGIYGRARTKADAFKDARRRIDYEIDRGELTSFKKVSLKEEKVITEIRKYLEKICKDMNVECLLNVYADHKRIIIATDGWLCTDVADPSRSEMPYLIRQAEQEFGASVGEYNAYKYREKFRDMLRKYGYSLDNESSCTMVAYRE